MFQMLFDLDELPHISRQCRLFSYNFYNFLSFYDVDHGDGSQSPLRPYVEGVLAQGGLSCADGKILLLCMPRMLGYVFNPISIYYCYGRSGDLVAMIYEVNNTFGQRHTYLIPAVSRVDGSVGQSCEKAFYVSPFMDMEMTYDFNVSAPESILTTTINGYAEDGARLIFATFRGARRELSTLAILRALVAYPLLTFGVVVAIHWEALKLFAKGIRFRHRPAAPDGEATVARPPTLGVG
jgi:hypothetical protein